MVMIYKIVPRDLWEVAKHEGVFKGAPVDLADGFIHFSAADQVQETYDRHFSGQNNLLLVGIREERLGDVLRWEPSRNNELFPHLYGDLDPSLISSEVPYNGTFVFPERERYRSFGMLALRSLPPETAHKATLRALSMGLAGRSKIVPDPVLRTELFGIPFINPVGLAAGFDKDAMVPDAMLRLGMGFVEVGTLTPKPQPGNPTPRIFRLEEDAAVINRLGFNNGGHDRALKRLEKRAGHVGIVGVNIGANKDSEDRINDYVLGVERFKHLADFFTVNISSPNTPGLRGLQDKEQLAALLALTADARGTDGPPLLLKVAPDLDEAAIADIAGLLKQSAFDGLIVSNTTIDRPSSLQSVSRAETGGLSGKPLFAPSTQVLREFYVALDGAMPIIGVGGIASGQDAYTKIRAGASLVELYSALTYKGPALIDEILTDLAALLKADGFSSVAQAVGADHK